jgi:DNA-binding CsgD family transcriptional regulator
MDVEALVDGIYEAAVVPEYWPRILEQICSLADGDAASLIAFGHDAGLRYVTTKSYEAAFSDYAANGASLPNIRPQRGLERMPMAFAHDLEVCSQAELDADPIYLRFARPYGFGWTAGTVVPVPSGDLIVYDVAKSTSKGPFTRAAMERLDPFRPHLARAALLAHRLRMQQARAVTEALDILGLPAAVVGRNRAVLAANASLQALAPRVKIGAFDRIYLQAKAADDLLAAALSSRGFNSVRSIPLAATENAPAIVAHVVPIRRAAGDIFARAEVLVLLTPVTAPSAPLTEVLTGLFDLTPAEAKVARGISVGRSVEQLAASHGISRETIRSQLKSLMMKTGTSRQVELAVLLSGLRSI